MMLAEATYSEQSSKTGFALHLKATRRLIVAEISKKTGNFSCPSLLSILFFCMVVTFMHFQLDLPRNYGPEIEAENLAPNQK